MKTLLMSMFILCSPLIALEFYNASFDEAIKLAKKENKLIFLMVEEEHCPWCKKMKSITLKDKKVMAILKKDYISIKINKNSNDLKRKYRTRLVPIMFLIDPNKEKELSKTVGYMNGNYFYDTLSITSSFDD